MLQISVNEYRGFIKVHKKPEEHQYIIKKGIKYRETYGKAEYVKLQGINLKKRKFSIELSLFIF